MLCVFQRTTYTTWVFNCVFREKMTIYATAFKQSYIAYKNISYVFCKRSDGTKLYVFFSGRDICLVPVLSHTLFFSDHAISFLLPVISSGNLYSHVLWQKSFWGGMFYQFHYCQIDSLSDTNSTHVSSTIFTCK